MEAARQLLSTLFTAAPDGYWVEIRPVPGVITRVPVDEIGQLDIDLGSTDTYFGVLPRRDKGAVDQATAVWLDVDDSEWTPEGVIPLPGAVVKSGKGTHVYWPLRRPVTSGDAVRLSRLAAVAYGGDRQVVEPMRVMRLPGSLNHKYDPPRPCTLVECHSGGHDPGFVEDNLVAALLIRHWLPGERHALGLGLTALLHRAGWDQKRIEGVIDILCRVADGDVRDLHKAVDSTFQKVAAGEQISTQAVKDALGDSFREVVAGLGIRPSPGQILEDGVPVGHRRTAERDLAKWVADLDLLGWAEGMVCLWRGTHWMRPSSREVVVSWVFDRLTTLTDVDDNGLEAPFAATLKLATSVSTIVAGHLAADPLPEPPEHMLPLANGVLNVRTGELTDHTKELGNTWVMPIEHAPGAECPMWERFVAEAAPRVVEFLREWIGYVLIRGNPLQKMLWLYGPPGTGKSTLIDVISDLVGDDAMVAITGGQFTPYEVASLAGKKVATCTEIRAGTLRTATLKALVSGDAVQARHPYGKPFPLRFGGKIIWASNNLPNPDEASGLFRRLSLVEFSVVPERVVNALRAKLGTELPGILNWALVGLERVLTAIEEDDPWTAPESVLESVAAYEDVANPFKMFAQEELIFGADKTTSVGELYLRYKAWCQERGLDPIKFGPQLWQELTQLGLTLSKEDTKDGRKQRTITGADLSETAF